MTTAKLQSEKMYKEKQGIALSLTSLRTVKYIIIPHQQL